MALLASFATAEDAKIQSGDSIPDWASDMALGMTLSTNGGEEPYQYFVVPLTATTGIDQSVSPSTVVIEGDIIQINPGNFEEVPDATAKEIAYLSCDEPSEDGDATANDMINKVMETNPMAIVLYSLVGNGCMLEGSDLIYQTIFTMIDSGDAQNALNFLNNTDEDDVVRAMISGNVTEVPIDASGVSNGTTSAVAMSVLYSITGLVTLLFLVIIGTGTLRAHRYPERYGLRSGPGGRPRQSRAKGIARAVLDTLPIIKFGGSSNGGSSTAKPDPDVESQTDAESRRPSKAGSDGARSWGNLPTITEVATPATATSPMHIPLAPISKAQDKDTRVPDDDGDNLGCSICTDDFSVGEDVRVLPCSHKFHPACVDPWLTNVSGTCPLCRLDLRPPGERDEVPDDDDNNMPPPLEFEEEPSTSQRRRISKLLDLSRLRHASPEERIQALRQYRHSQAQEAAPPTGDDHVDRGRRARLADKLRDKFRIRTRTQSPGS
ncbi:uncharacterized protein DNG_06110 [Cephalotrichum gorgonifer]|uniref:RING-type domain-containing protein n=1 Tax=Cephalotrichum gorgonifer TaxID=2041049 RepID=A0AAE8MZD5_9PEZI|nr:uncharacterized protein DNG_06110 [Cephalotrichum gorgonifer]